MTHINVRRNTSGTWTSVNPVLQLGEVGIETNTRKTKQGDGVTAWNSLPYATEPLANAALTGTPTAPTPAPGDASTKIATTQYVDDAAAGFVSAASPAFTGTPTAPTPSAADDSTKIATTAYVKDQFNNTALTGVPTAPTASTSDDSTQIATTAFVKDQNYVDSDSPTLDDVILTGTTTAPTASVGDDSTKIATTAFVENYMEDTGWVNITLNTADNWAVGAGRTPKYRVRNGRCSLFGSITRTSGSDVEPFTLPSGVRPLIGSHRGVVRSDGADPAIWFNIDTTGVADVQPSQVANGDLITLDGLSSFFVI